MPNISMHHVGKKLCIGSKNGWHHFNGLEVLYHQAKFWEDRTTHAGCRCENAVFVFFLSRSESGSRGIYFEQLNYSDAVYGSIFDSVFKLFFGIDCLSESLDSYFCR